MKPLSNNTDALLAQANLRLLAGLRSYEAGTANQIDGAQTPLLGETALVCGDARLRVTTEICPLHEIPDAVAIAVTFVAETACESISVSLDCVADSWSRDNYVLIPGAAYNGNRFSTRIYNYPPMFTDPADIRPDIDTIITDVPRLEIGEGTSHLQLLARDAVTPALGFFAPKSQSGVFLLTEERNGAGPTGLEIKESEDSIRSSATLSVTAPGVRSPLRYDGNQIRKASEDRGVSLAVGEQITLLVYLYVFPCADIPALFIRFAALRKDLTGDPTLALDLPFSAAWAIQEAKYNNENWQGVGAYDFAARSFRRGYYTVGTGRSQFDDFQIGWVGGAINTYALLARGDDTSRDRAKRTLDWLFSGGQAESGYFKSIGFRGEWFDDGFGKTPTGTDFHLIRKSADALYFLLKQFLLLEKRGEAVPDTWKAGARRCADAFVQTWKQFGQWGQFVSERTGDVLVGNSAAAGIAPGALMLAAEYFNHAEYGTVGAVGAHYLYEQFTRNGITTGGPGEILQCPDSESAYGLLESFVALYESTRNAEWLGYAQDAACQCASWHVSYDYHYPRDSEFGKKRLWSAGSVLANVQNKHSAPGICTLSGDSLWKLFRATGDRFYLTLLQETARNLTQYLSHADRPMHDLHGRVLPPGYMNERVNLSDWDNNIGGVFYGSCWCEVSLMLTFAEVPGVYVQSDTGICVSLDHVEAKLISTPADGTAIICLHNPTNYPAQVAIWCETSETARTKPIGMNALMDVPLIEIMPGATVEIAAKTL